MTGKEVLHSRLSELWAKKGYADGLQYDCSRYLRTGNDILDCIVQYQSHYFSTGDKKKLIPMVYKDIATVLEKDISTVARVVEGRTYRLNRETQYFKELFKEGVLKDRKGREIAQAEFFEAIQNIILNEDKRKPYSDGMIASFLNDAGYNIARRTVCKYRSDFLGIPDSRNR